MLRIIDRQEHTFMRIRGRNCGLCEVINFSNRQISLIGGKLS